MKLRSLYEEILTNPKLVTLFAAFTPAAAEDRGVDHPRPRRTRPVRDRGAVEDDRRFLRVGIGGGPVAVGTITVFGLALATATSALALMLVAVGIVYYLMTQVLGVRLELDPQVLIRQAMQAQRPSSAPN